MALRVFSVFALDPAGRVLRRDGQPVKLHDQPLEILIALTDRPGEIVGREELRRRLWPDDTFVDYDNSLNNALSRLRECLQVPPDHARLIETIPKRGYRFVAPVRVVETNPSARTHSRRHRWTAVAAILSIAAAAAAGLLLRQSSPVPAPARHRLVVLPLQNLTGRADLDYLVAGLGDDLTTHLGRLAPDDLAVIARTTAASYAARDAALTRAAAELGADHAIEGAVRYESERVHATIRLVRTADSRQVWAEMFDAPLTAMPRFFETVVTRTARAVGAALGRDAEIRARGGTLSTDAFDAWLRGRSEWSRFTLDGFAASIGWYERALSIDAGFPEAAAGLAQSWVFVGVFDAGRAVEAYGRAGRAVDRALALDPQNADALAMRGMVKLFGRFDARGAAADFDAALSRVPNDALILHWAAAAASARGDHDRGVALGRAARSLDPRSVAVNADLGWYFYYARRFDEAIQQCAVAARLDPAARGPALCREMASRAARRSPVVPGGYAAGDRSALYRRAADSAALGDRRAAVEAISTAVTLHASWVPFLAVDPAFERLRGDRDFDGILARVAEAAGSVRR
jgi:DNA-binding winged helix-turn-helix (wHTH) protein/TolB-like protein